MDRKKIIKTLESKDYILLDGRVYFRSINGYIVSLSENYYFKRQEELRQYFSKRDEKDQKRLILENLSLFASPLPDREYHPKIEVVYQSGVCTVVKISEYSPDEDCSSPTIKELTSMRGEKLEEESRESWNTAREREDPRIMEYARKMRNWLRGDKD